MTTKAGQQPDKQERPTQDPSPRAPRAPDGPGRAGPEWSWPVLVAWLLAVPTTAYTLALEYGITREYGPADVGQYLLALPAVVLVGMAVWLTLRGTRRADWAPLGVAISVVVTVGAVVAATVLGMSARDTASAQACSPEDTDVLSSLPMFDEAGGALSGYPDGGCYLRFVVPGDLADATPVLHDQLTGDGWVVQDAGSPWRDGRIYFKDDVTMYVEVEGLGNLESVDAPVDATGFRLTIFGEVADG